MGHDERVRGRFRLLVISRPTRAMRQQQSGIGCLTTCAIDQRQLQQACFDLRRYSAPHHTAVDTLQGVELRGGKGEAPGMWETIAPIESRATRGQATYREGAIARLSACRGSTQRLDFTRHEDNLGWENQVGNSERHFRGHLPKMGSAALPRGRRRSINRGG
jgi:hypothetical protein